MNGSALNCYRVGNKEETFDTTPTEDDAEKLRERIEPWLTSVFQSEHLSLLLGSGFTTAITYKCGASAADMSNIKFDCELEDKVNLYAKKTAERCGRGDPNIEDQIRSALALISGLEVMQDTRLTSWVKSIDNVLHEFLLSLLKTERDIRESIVEKQNYAVKELLISFLLSFASRTATRERLNIFTSNYDRLIEYGCDEVGLRIIDRFVGTINPIFRSSRLEVDMHYNPPGIRGEPRYLEGVVKLTKLHGSLDWRITADSELRRYGIPFGAKEDYPDILQNPLNSVMIYPNPAKDIETLEYPYAELFRDYSAALCRPNSVLVTYGYGFGDDHINRVIKDMLTIPSTHVVIISFDDNNGRIKRFCDEIGRKAQISLLIGNHFGDITNLVRFYLPKPAIDRITERVTDILTRRGIVSPKPQDKEKGVCTDE